MRFINSTSIHIREDRLYVDGTVIVVYFRDYNNLRFQINVDEKKGEKECLYLLEGLCDLIILESSPICYGKYCKRFGFVGCNIRTKQQQL